MNQQESIKWIKKTCGEGWAPLVEKLYAELPIDISVTSIYQKWGALMFDAKPWNETVEKLHDEIEELSLQICEVCGQPGKRTKINEWVHTRCGKHGTRNT